MVHYNKLREYKGINAPSFVVDAMNSKDVLSFSQDATKTVRPIRKSTQKKGSWTELTYKFLVLLILIDSDGIKLGLF